ncbi:MAG: DUF1540 domain-containing protein [Tyzzerella sp.]|nr:DUF1540 domain-containing protein [Tyzzerella sp.]
MPELKCSVVTCVHNTQNYCELDAIEVMGNTANISEETSCGSFVEIKDNEYKNRAKDASVTSEIKCHARECKYNDEYKCYAGKINVVGSSASRSDETECATFKK